MQWRATCRKLRRKAFLAGTPTSETNGVQLKKTLNGVDLLFMGIGGIIGAGVFVLTGVAARQEAGPAVVLSYVVASFAAIQAAFCYTEFAVDMPVAGGAFVFVNVIFGELIGWCDPVR